MDLKEYLKELVEKVDKKEDEGGCLGIYVTDKIKFMYHDDCFADFQEDFCILYDKVTECKSIIPYGKISMMEYMTDDIIKKQAKEMDISKLLKKLMED